MTNSTYENLGFVMIKDTFDDDNLYMLMIDKSTGIKAEDLENAIDLLKEELEDEGVSYVDLLDMLHERFANAILQIYDMHSNDWIKEIWI